MGGKYNFSDIPPDERRQMAESCGLTEEEILVFEMRAKTDRVTPTSMRLCMSDRTVKRRSASIARKIARAGHRACTRASDAQKACNR